MDITKKAAAATAFAFALLLPAAPALAEDYVGGNPPCTPGNPDSGSGVDADDDGTPDECQETDGSVGSGGEEKPGEATKGGAGGAEVAKGGGAGGPGAAAAAAPTGSLPVTGSDVAGLALIGAAAVATGAVLVSRSRRSSDTTAG